MMHSQERAAPWARGRGRETRAEAFAIHLSVPFIVARVETRPRTREAYTADETASMIKYQDLGIVVLQFQYRDADKCVSLGVKMGDTHRRMPRSISRGNKGSIFCFHRSSITISRGQECANSTLLSVLNEADER
ncbi:uncharacterized protein LAESUDRAFT_564037 [Laetiporus sulphureus 93-53]|uniref:Uncharacterized protein n=1 Tax=Laetiporus sulphureus 93-53 TaxID=1314785 RepID=A0A165B4C9_9APHY|nr:uncharacterized protein LAESUDRAFT_564037 [Laetiporus sulphureus 93-53]KZT00205.1 hypothetical protein LAESUDRAFT_564037 [Laetiporus sulphureus 93-53]